MWSGLEFLNRTVQALLKKNGIHHFSSHNAETKASIVERFNRKLKTHMWRYFTKHQTWRYIDVLQDLVQSYNNSPHRSIGMAPSQVSAKSKRCGSVCTATTVRACPSSVCRIACVSVSSRDYSLRVRGELERRDIHDTRGSSLRSTRLPTNRRSRRSAGWHLLRTGTADSVGTRR